MPRTLRPTTAGRYLLGIAMLMGFAAMNTGNNLLFLAWGLVLGAILVSGLLSESTLRVLKVAAKRQSPVFAGDEVSVLWRVKNTSARWPAFSVRIEVAFAQTPAVRAPDDNSRTINTAAHGYILRHDPSADSDIALRATFARRGVWRAQRTYVRTEFPFGFFEKSRWFASAHQGEVLVFPPKVPVRFDRATFRPKTGQHIAKNKGLSDEYFSLKRFRPGDDPRRIHWKKSARAGHLLALETARATDDDVIVALIVAGDGDDDEDALSILVSLVEQLIDDKRAVGVRLPGRAVAVGRGPAHLQQVRTEAALCDLNAATPLDDLGASAPVVAVVGPNANPPPRFSAVHTAALAAGGSYG